MVQERGEGGVIRVVLSEKELEEVKNEKRESWRRSKPEGRKA